MAALALLPAWHPVCLRRRICYFFTDTAMLANCLQCLPYRSMNSVLQISLVRCFTCKHALCGKEHFECQPSWLVGWLVGWTNLLHNNFAGHSAVMMIVSLLIVTVLLISHSKWHSILFISPISRLISRPTMWCWFSHTYVLCIPDVRSSIVSNESWP